MSHGAGLNERRLKVRGLGFALVALAAADAWGQTPPAGSEAPPSQTPASAPTAEVEQLRREVEALRQEQEQLRAGQSALRRQVEATREAASETVGEARPESTFSVYGFFDTSFMYWHLPSDAALKAVIDSDPAFVFGNLNLYFDFKPLPTWRMLTEVRFLLNPAGDIVSYGVPVVGQSFERLNTSTSNHNGVGEQFQWGGIKLERSQLEWTQLEWLNVAVGLFLTPYGIWNIDHGSPARISVNAPAMYGWQMFPERQLGLQLLGGRSYGDTRVEYALSLSNGRGPAATLFDIDKDKGVGGRLAVTSGRGFWRWKAGLSFYTGQFTDEAKNIVVSPVVDMTRDITVRYREYALEGDVQVMAGPVHLQWETMANWRNYDDQYRPGQYYFLSYYAPAGILSLLGLGGPTAKEADFTWWGSSVLVAYQLPLPKVVLRPYLNLDYIDTNDNIKNDNTYTLGAGLNWRLSGAVVLKVECRHSWWPNRDTSKPLMLLFNSPAITMVNAQIAVAF